MIIPFQEIGKWRINFGYKRVICGNGIFDVITPAHIYLLENAKRLGDILIIGLTNDENTRKLKGSNRPIYNENDRAKVIDSIKFVDAVTIFPDINACNFIMNVSPDIYFKGGDYSVDTINPDEKELLTKIGLEVQFLPFLEGFSTTETLKKLKSTSGKKLKKIITQPN